MQHHFNQNKLLFRIYGRLTDGNFPYKTYNHVLAGYNANLRASFNLFRREKFLLQEIASEKSISDSVYKGGGEIIPVKVKNNTVVTDNDESKPHKS